MNLRINWEFIVKPQLSLQGWHPGSWKQTIIVHYRSLVSSKKTVIRSYLNQETGAGEKLQNYSYTPEMCLCYLETHVPTVVASNTSSPACKGVHCIASQNLQEQTTQICVPHHYYSQQITSTRAGEQFCIMRWFFSSYCCTSHYLDQGCICFWTHGRKIKKVVLGSCFKKENLYTGFSCPQY